MMELSVEKDAGEMLSAPSPTVIKIIGCGGGGSSAVNRMIGAGVSDVEFIVMNTDMQALRISKAQRRIPIGQQLTGGLGAGGNPDVGEKAAEEDVEVITNIVSGANMVIITAGMGGGTGTGSVPVVARIAKEQGCLTLAVVTTPFDFEGSARKEYAANGIKKLREHVDSLIVIPNQQIMKITGNDRSLNYKQAFKLSDDVLCQGVMGITEIITKPGEINCDFADMKTVMNDQGEAILGVGIAGGENRAVEAAQNAIYNPMLENRSIDGASNILVNITSAEDLGMIEVEEIIKTISASANPHLKLFWGQVLDPNMGDKISVTVIATGFEQNGDGRSLDDDGSSSHSNVVSMDTFDEIMGFKSNKTPRPAQEPKPSNIPVNPQIINEEPVRPSGNFFSQQTGNKSYSTIASNISMGDKFSMPGSDYKDPYYHRPVNEPPANIDLGDRNQPATWRDPRKNRPRSHSIDLSSDSL